MHRPPSPLRALSAALALTLSVGAARADDSRGPAAPTNPASPRLVLDRTTCALGALRPGERRDGTFVVKNVGTAPLHLSARGSCGCTPVALSVASVAPGGESVVSVAVEAGRTSGTLHKTAYLTSDDPANPTTTLVVEGDVSKGVLLSRSALTFGAVRISTAPRASIDVFRRDGATAGRVTSARVADLLPTSARVEVDLEPLGGDDPVGRRVVVRFLEPPALGPISGRLLVATDDPDAPELSLPVWGLVSPAVSVAPRELRLGAARPGAAALATVTVRGFDDTVRLGRVTARARDGRFTATVAIGAEPSVATVVVGVAREAPVGPLRDVLVISTEVEGEAPIEVPVATD